MKNLFASCAVIALMAAPALAQSTFEPTDPLVQTPEDLDPTKRNAADQPTGFETGLPETEETVEEATETSDDTVTSDTETDAETDPVQDAQLPNDNDDMTVADAEPTFDTQTAEMAQEIEAPINVADLPDDYSSEDLNAMMLAQLNVVAEEIADANAEAGTNVYASAETSISQSSEMGSSTWTPSEESVTEDYPASDMDGDTSAQTETYATEDYAASESGFDGMTSSPSADDSMVPVAPGLETDMAQTEGEEAILAEEADESLQMAEQSDGTFVTAEGDIDQSAADIAAGDSRFSTLIELVGTAGLEEALSQDGSYTVFAPTNDAFAALPEETLTRLKSEEGKAELTEILKSHLVEGAVLAGAVPLGGQSVETLSDTSLFVTGSTDGTLNVQGSNTIGEGIVASNGVVYAIDAVILPEAAPAETDS